MSRDAQAAERLVFSFFVTQIAARTRAARRRVLQRDGKGVREASGPGRVSVLIEIEFARGRSGRYRKR